MEDQVGSSRMLIEMRLFYGWQNAPTNAFYSSVFLIMLLGYKEKAGEIIISSPMNEDGTTSKSSREAKQLGYFHPDFHRDHPERLSKIRRKAKAHGKGDDDATAKQNEEVEALQQEVASLKSIVQRMRCEMEMKMPDSIN